MHSAAPVYFENVNAHLFEIANEMHFLISQMHKIKHEDLELFKHFEARFDELSKKLEQIREKVGDKADALVQSLSNLKTRMNDYAELLRSTKIEKIKNFSNRFEEESSKFKKEFSTKIAEKQLKYKELNEKIGIQYEEFLLNFKSSSLNP